MTSYGQVLHDARVEKNLTLADVSQKTNISIEYLNDLENERTLSLPGETYVVGFLHNYSEFLELDADKIVSLFRAAKMQAEPVPEILTHDEPKKRRGGIFVLLTVLVVAAAGGVFAYRLAKKRSEAALHEASKKRAAKTYEFAGKILENLRVYRDDKIVANVGEKKITVSIGSTSPSLQILLPQGTQFVELGDSADIDLDGNSTPDVTILVNDISKTDVYAGAELTILPAVQSGGEVALLADDENDMQESDGSNLVNRENNVIFDTPSAFPIMLNLKFRGQCLLFHSADGNARVEKNYRQDETLEIEANNSIRLWIMNANLVNMQITGMGRTRTLEIGSPGQVLCEDIKWIRKDGRYQLVVLPVD